MKVFEVHFTFTPPDPSMAGEGLVTVSAESQDEAQAAFLKFMEDTAELEIKEIREVVELPEHFDLTPRTIN